MSIFKPLTKPLIEEVRDQALHAVHALLLMAAVVFISSPPIAVLTVTAEAILWELKQKNWNYKLIGRRDIATYVAASLFFTGCFYLLS